MTQSETTILADIDKDGKPELVYAAQGQFRYAKLPAPGTEKWVDYNVSEKGYSLSNPTDAVNLLNSIGFDKLIDLDLSLPNKVSNQRLFQKKINSKPRRFITQSIGSIQEIRDLKDLMKPYHIELIPCIMVPSVKNEGAATMIGLDWSEYQDNFPGFLKEVYKETDHILITSPNSFDEGIKVLKNSV